MRKSTAHTFKNIQNGEIVGESERYAWEQWAVGRFVFGKSRDISADHMVDVDSEP